VFARLNRLKHIDCQQSTSHLKSLGAIEWTRERFLQTVEQSVVMTSPSWVMPNIGEHLTDL
jgi:leucyl/phenylalanyl-tRNA--protein transferase